MNQKITDCKGDKTMEQKLLFFDIDGTLLTEGTGEIPESTRKAVKMAKEEGHLLFVNTGRTRTSLPQKVTSLDFHGYVCGCGTNIFLGDQELLLAKLSNKLCTQVAETVRKYRVPVFYEASDAIYFDHQIPDDDGWIKNAQKIFQLQGRDIEEVIQGSEKVYDKLLIVLKPTRQNQELKEYLSRYFLCIDRGGNMYEVIQKDYSKATGIRFLCDYLGKNIEDCYVFGDSENDRSMLEAVPNSIAMGNSEKAIKECCSYVTKDIKEDGIYEAMRHFGLIRS